MGVLRHGAGTRETRRELHWLRIMDISVISSAKDRYPSFLQPTFTSNPQTYTSERIHCGDAMAATTDPAADIRVVEPAECAGHVLEHLPMSRAHRILVSIICDHCRRVLRRSLHDVGWINVFTCPKCQGTIQLEAGANATVVAEAMRTLTK